MWRQTAAGDGTHRCDDRAKVWEGPTSALTLDGVERTAAEDGAIHVLPAAAPLDLSRELTCDWRDGDLW